MLVSTIHQHESAIGIHMSPPAMICFQRLSITLPCKTPEILIWPLAGTWPTAFWCALFLSEYRIKEWTTMALTRGRNGRELDISFYFSCFFVCFWSQALEEMPFRGTLWKRTRKIFLWIIIFSATVLPPSTSEQQQDELRRRSWPSLKSTRQLKEQPGGGTGGLGGRAGTWVALLLNWVPYFAISILMKRLAEEGLLLGPRRTEDQGCKLCVPTTSLQLLFHSTSWCVKCFHTCYVTG